MIIQVEHRINIISNDISVMKDHVVDNLWIFFHAKRSILTIDNKDTF